MIRTLRRRFFVRPQGDEGIALIMVMGSIVVLGLLVTAAIGYAMQSQPQQRRDQAWQAALAAAQAGVDDFVAKLNADDTYYDTIDCNNIALKGPNTGTNTCGYTAATVAGWKEVQSNDVNAGSFHYDLDASGLFRDGYMTLTVTGKSLNEARTLQVRVGKPGSTQYLYYTDYESSDPANRTAYRPSGATTDQCGKSGTSLAKYYWEGRSGCQEIQFAGSDVLDGPVHFNDEPLFGGAATFKKGFETSDPDCKSVTGPNWSACGRTSQNPTIPSGQKARYANVLTLPDTSDQLDLADRSCKYTGDTRIKFLTNGTMQVWSKGAVTAVGGLSCGTAGTAAGRLGHSAGQNLPQPDEALIYVKNGTTTSRCTTGQIGDGLPLATDWNYTNTTSPENAYYCGNGNAYVEGTVSTRLSVGAQNSVFVTGNILLKDVTAGAAPSGPYMVGLVAANSVYVYHPVTCSEVWTAATDTSTGDKNVGYCRTSPMKGANILANTTRYIYASIQTLQHSFTVQSYDLGADIGTLSVRGSIAQRWRGAVGTGGGTGYDKDYGYDTRLVYSSPPYFPKLDGAGWGSKVTGEVKPQF